MPPRPEFCYYEALDVPKTATQPEIVSAYRKLALQHHPDRNLDNPDATANFQRIQAAHETLSDPSKRTNYDRLVSGAPRANARTSPFDWNPYREEDEDEDDYYFDEDEDDEDFPHMFFDSFFFSRRESEFEFRFTSRRQETYEEMRERFEEQERREEAQRAINLAVYRAKQDQLEKDRVAKEKAQQEFAAKAQKAFENREKEERTAQEKRWSKLKTATQEEKQASCLHSEFWTKEQQKRKFKCSTCRQKRGMVAFKCPHCTLLACQVCVNTFRGILQDSG